MASRREYSSEQGEGRDCRENVHKFTQISKGDENERDDLFKQTLGLGNLSFGMRLGVR